MHHTLQLILLKAWKQCVELATQPWNQAWAFISMVLIKTCSTQRFTPQMVIFWLYHKKEHYTLHLNLADLQFNHKKFVLFNVVLNSRLILMVKVNWFQILMKIPQQLVVLFVKLMLLTLFFLILDQLVQTAWPTLCISKHQ